MSPKTILQFLVCCPVLVVLLVAGQTAHAQNTKEAQRFLSGKSCFRCDLRYLNAAGLASKGTDLRAAYMFDINLSNSRLIGTRLESANLEMSNLERVDLSRATLDRANLSYASLAGATLIGSSLVNITSEQSNFDGTDLSEANLTGARL